MSGCHEDASWTVKVTLLFTRVGDATEFFLGDEIPLRDGPAKVC